MTNMMGVEEKSRTANLTTNGAPTTFAS